MIYENKKFLKGLRICTLPPIMALLMLSVLYCFCQGVFGGVKYYLLAVLFLVIIPVLAYVFKPVRTDLPKGGRERQRSVAMWLSLGSYLMGSVLAAILKTSFELKKIYLVYVISGLLMLFFNKVLGIRASGHACGVMGAGVCLFDSVGFPALFGCLLLVAVYMASLKLRRHSWGELIVGSMIPILSSCMIMIWCLMCWAYEVMRF